MSVEAVSLGKGRRMFLSLTVSELSSKEHRLRLRRGRQLGNRRNAHEKDKRDWSDSIGSNRAVRGAYIRSSIARQRYVFVHGQGASISPLVHLVRRRQRPRSRRIGRPATPSSVSASKPGRPRIRAPSIISRIEIAKKGRGNRSGSFSPPCNYSPLLQKLTAHVI